MQYGKFNMQNTKHPSFASIGLRRASERRGTGDGTRLKAGSAFILAVVMTSLLAIVGVMFLMSARVEKISTSAISENKELNLAVESVIAIISKELAADLPGEPDEEYYDYPDSNNAWLASIEPYQDSNDPNANDYYWRQISDVTGFLDANGFSTQNVDVAPTGLSTTTVVREYPEIQVNSNGKFLDENGNLATDGISADADGDGIADSKWIRLADITTNKGKPIYAAIRIIDNGAMLNINTSYEFDPNGETNSERIDGSSQTQINLAAVARENDDINDISSARGIPNPTDGELLDYQNDFIWRVGSDNNDYTPFDISDELELRYRFCINSRTFNRIEDVWPDTTKSTDNEGELYDGSSNQGLSDWQINVTDPCDPNDQYNRHLLTYYNMDRIIDPNGYIMLNININASELDNKDDNYSEPNSYNKAIDLYDQFTKCIDPNLDSSVKNRMREKFAQLAVNIVDLRDHESDVTSVKMETLEPDPNKYNGDMEYFYGLEPHPVITKIGIWIDPYDPSKDPNDPNDPANPKDASDPNYDPNENTNYYAIELFNPFDVNIPLNDFVLLVTDYNDDSNSSDPNYNSKIIAEIPLFLFSDSNMDPNDYYVIHSPNNVNDILFDNLYDIPFSIKPGTPTLSANFELSADYAVTYDANGPVIVHSDPNIRIDPNIVDSRNLAIRRSVKADSNTISRDIYVDRQLIYKDWVRWDHNDWDNRADPNLGVRYYKRNFEMEDNSWWYVIYPDMIRDSNNSPLGQKHLGTSSPNPMPYIDIAMPWNSNTGYLGDLVTVGDISRIWTIGPHDYLFDPEDMNEPNDANIYDPNTLLPFEPNDPNNPYDINEPNDANGIYANYNSYSRTVGETLKLVSRSRSKNYDREDLEELIRLNLADADYRNLFQYITVFYPADHDQWAGETRIKGRININTAPWYVISQLPWMRDDIAKAIVAYRDKLDLDPNGPDYSDPNFGRWKATGIYNVREAAGFESIGELATVINDSGEDEYSMHWYALDSTDINSFPDLTLSPDDDADGAEDDFEERDIIFSRISNLVTVRSDVYTAYILVRIGTDGPQKRYIAIFDRSDPDDPINGPIKVIALQQVPDPR